LPFRREIGGFGWCQRFPGVFLAQVRRDGMDGISGLQAMPMIRRDLTSVLRSAATLYPVVTLTGPRRSGKTTLCRATFTRKP
jgi:type II secretory ATPase GspE/PulE/Tfp pilus assembly ATPase PilB-like protein